MTPLTERQSQIVDMARRGYSAKSIAKVLGVTHSTIHGQYHLIRKKGVDCPYITPKEERESLNMDEAQRIARSYR